MKPFSLLLLLCVGSCYVQSCCPDCSAGEQVGEMVALPDIEGVCWTVFIDDGSPTAQRLATWLETDPVLNDLVTRQTRFYGRASDDPHYLKTLAPELGPAPLFALQAPDGLLIFRANDGKIASTPRQLANDIRSTVQTWDRLGRPGTPSERAEVGFDPCPLCPSPAAPRRRRPQSAEPVDDLQEKETPWGMPEEIPWWWPVLAGLIAGGCGCACCRKK